MVPGGGFGSDVDPVWFSGFECFASPMVPCLGFGGVIVVCAGGRSGGG